jgi:hypothetical protein
MVPVGGGLYPLPVFFGCFFFVVPFATFFTGFIAAFLTAFFAALFFAMLILLYLFLYRACVDYTLRLNLSQYQLSSRTRRA